jgi:hypothetical protein
MCGEGAQTFFLEELTLGRALSVAPNTAARSFDAEERGQAAARELAASGLRASATRIEHSHSRVEHSRVEHDDAPPAWCISPDDPRCAPHDQGAPLQGQRAHVPMQDVTAMHWPELAANSCAANLRPEQLGAPSAGVGLRIERPPRT